MERISLEKLKQDLCSRITKSEWTKLEEADKSLYINEFNRSVMLRMKTAAPGEGSADPKDLKALEDDLAAYLNEYMADHPEGHKWIIIACLFLTFIERRPMHPQSAAGWTEKDGRFYCPHKVEDSLTCRYCACE